ncbi:MetQ/NlpA family ABC transporter substrate-binding protein [Ignatzschineria rhizosphaerae]|uniref:MetQ/NlpA family ABC transporter substrate-binding protein n=1 Tax=Ignatzschineria rhizosphaerae TaxID=2923279 RepID=A0ABY3X3W1_9GAMM|nr:MetQ/NlpA family ABC transporter substrate-binding protein [Ignatzschineria rhizosphaerae]UNM96565.1 MetQ/NlpA family ABC transporter substrate-binding protein [Ignatzschineria rhizosphaerae]
MNITKKMGKGSLRQLLSKMPAMLSVFKIGLLFIAGMILAACSEEQGEKKEIVFGLGPSIYVNQVEGGIIPLLEQKGYKVSIKTFSQNSMIPPALKEGAVDVSVHISTANLQEMNRRLGGDAMMVWADTPSAPQTIRSLRHQSIDDIRDGMTIAIPSDPVSSERAARLLESVGWIELAPEIDVSTFHVNEIKPGSVTPKIVEMESALMLRALQDIDFAVVNGNFVTNAGERIQDGLAIEDSPEEHLVKVAILEKNQHETWAKDIKEAYESKEFEVFIKNDPIYEGLIFPKSWSK